MENINFGSAKKNVLKKTINYFIDNEKINESTTKFINVVSNSPILSIEFEIYKNIEEKHIENDTLAGRYIDNNIKLLDKFNINEINNAHELLKEFITEDTTIKNYGLYKNIAILITENNINKIHDAYSGVLDHLKTNKPKLMSEENKPTIDENIDLSLVIGLAIKKFNKKYTTLNETNVGILNVIIEKDTNKQKEFFESLKKNNIDLLNEANLSTGIEDKINKSLKKINEMEYNNLDFSSDIIRLQNLKNSLTVSKQ